MSRFYNLDQAPFNGRELSKAIIAAIAGQYNGAFFDAQDMSTMFQDAAGTVPVTAMEQPVGKWLDKSGNGNHATQSVTASRPTLSARYNLLTKTEDFSDSTWFKGTSNGTAAPIVTQNYAAGVDAQSSAARVQLTLPGDNEWSIVRITNTNITFGVNESFTDSLYVKATDSGQIGKKINLYTYNYGVQYGVIYTLILTSNWQLITAPQAFTVASTAQEFSIGKARLSAAGQNDTRGISNSETATDFLICKPSRVRGSTPLPYQRVNTATDYDTNPVMFPKYLKWDAVDDYLNLPFMNLYGGGAASIIAARDGVSQATDTYIISERSTTSANQKYFPSRQLANAGNMDAYIVNDAGTVVVDTVGSAYDGASDAVIRSVVDSGNNIKLFKNGALAANDNYTRSGTLTLTNTTIGASVSTTTSNYAKMKLYGLAITKYALSDAERRRVERLLAYNSGAQI